MVETYEVNGKEYTKEEVEAAFETVSKVFRSVVEAVSQIAKDIVDEIQRIVDYITEKRVEKQYEYNWQVPKNIIKNHQVLIRKPMLANIRNSI